MVVDAARAWASVDDLMGDAHYRALGVEAAASARLQFEGEGDIDDAQRAKRERAQDLMRKFQEQAKELERLHAQAKASQPDEL